LESLQAFAAGKMHYGKAIAVADFKRSVQLDANFSLAYRWLGSCYNNLIQRDAEAENLTRAYQLRGRSTRRDRFDIKALYYLSVTGEFEKGIAALEQAAHDFPRWYKPRSNLDYALRLLGQYEKSVEVEREAIRGIPDNPSVYGNLASSYTALDRLEDAGHILGTCVGDAIVWHSLQNDHNGMEEQVRWAQDKPAVADFILREQSETEAYYGRLHDADEFTRQAVVSAARAGAAERGAEWKAIAALRAAKLGETTRSRGLAQEAIGLNPNRRAKQMAAEAFARLGDTMRATQLAQELNQENPLNTLIQGCELPVLRAQLYIQQDNPADAIKTLEQALPYDVRFSDQFWDRRKLRISTHWNGTGLRTGRGVPEVRAR
jgi:tetratricopeptide (TPR) repeat protein